MSQHVDIETDRNAARASRLVLRLIFVGIGMMALAGGLMWWRFGPSMFMDLVTAAANCF
jgi:hypothetical protein